MVCRWTRAACVVMLLLAAAGCTDSASGPDDERDYTFPLHEGDSWEYAYRMTFPVFAGARDAVIDTLYAHYWLEVAQRETLADSIGCYRLAETALYDTVNYGEASYYYDNEADGLYSYAYEGLFASLGVAPKPSPGTRMVIGGLEYSAVRAALARCAGFPAMPGRPDSLIFEDPPVRCLAYPLTVGREWVYRQPGAPWAINKRVLAVEQVEVPAGTFECYAVRWLIDFWEPHGEWDDDIEWVDYFSDSGLVRRTIMYYDVVVTSPDDPVPIDTLDLWEEAVLTDAQVE